MALIYGMSAGDFWENEPELMWAYRKSFLDKKKIEKEINNFNSWLQGLYIFDGVSKAIYNSFGRKNNSVPLAQYTAEPYDLNQKKEDIERKRILEVEEKIKERTKVIKKMLQDKKGE